MEDDIFSIATEPINISNSNIYEEETQAILGAFDSPSILDESENRSQSNLSGSYCDGSPTQRLNHAEKEKYIGSYIVQTPEESKVHDVDSDCETIPASPVFDIDPIQEDIQMQRENISPFSSVKENFDPQPSASRSHGLGKPTRESKKVISNLSQEDEDSLCYPTQPLRKKKEIVASVDDSMDAPTQRLPQVRNLVTTAEGVSVDEPTQWLPDSTKSSILVADYGVKTPCQSPLERIEIETSMDAPTQKLPETKILVTMTEESSMDAPTQPLPHGRKALSECENSMDAPTQPLQHGRKMCALIDNENSLDAPTQPLREKRKAIVISDDGDSMDAVTQPLPKSQTRLRKQSFRATPRQTYDSDSEERPASPTLDLGLQLPLLKDKSDHLESPVLTVETDEETQRIDFDPQFLFDPCQAGALDSVSPVPFYGNTSLKHTNAASASSTPLQNKKKPPRGLAASPSRTSLDEQLSPHKTSEKGSPSVKPSEQEEKESDVETIPGSPGLDFGTPSDIVPCSQEGDEELSPSVKRSLVWKALQKTCEPRKEAGFSSPDASPKKPQAKDTKENQSVTPKSLDANACHHHETVLSSRDETNCESPVFDFDDTSEAIVDETRAASPPRYSLEGSPPIIAETPYIRDAESPRKRRKIIRRSGYTISDSTFLQVSTACEDAMTENTEEESPIGKPPQQRDLGSESEQSDFELTFISHYSSAPNTSPNEPFLGFTKDDKEQISSNLKLIRRVIDTDERELVSEKLQDQRPSTSKNPRRSSRRPVPNLRNSNMYELDAPGVCGQSKPKRPCLASRSSTSPVSNSAVDMDIASSDEGEQGPSSGVARKRRTVSKTPSTTNVTVDMEIASSDDAREQGEDTPKACRSKRSPAAEVPGLTAPISADASDQAAGNVLEPEVTKKAPKPIRKTRSKRLSDVAEMVPGPNFPKPVHVGELKQIENEYSERKPPQMLPDQAETGTERTKTYNTRMKATSDSEKEEKTVKVKQTADSRHEKVTVPTQSTEAENGSIANADQPPSRKKEADRKKNVKALDNKQEDAVQALLDPIKSGPKVDNVSEQPVPSENEIVIKQSRARGRLNRKAAETKNQPTGHQNPVSTASHQALKVEPVSEAVENVNNQQTEPQSKRRVTRSRKSKKENSSAASESSDDAGETKQTAVASTKSKEEQVYKSKTTGEEPFHQPELPVRRARRLRLGSDASSVSNATARSEAESSDEAATSKRQTTKRCITSAESAESSSEEDAKGKRLRSGRQTRTASLKSNETSVSESTPQPPTPNAPLKRGRGRPSKKGALNDSVSSSSGVGTSQSRPTRLSNLNASVSSSPSVEASRRRKRALAGQVRVLFTVIDDENDRETVARLGGKVVTHFKDCSVLVTDRIRRTVKFLCCVGLGVPIVGLDWLEKCRASGKFLDPWLYLLRDKEGEEKFNFKLGNSLKVASETPLLSGCIFHATPGVKPPPAEMQEIVDACGGFYVEENDKSIENKFVISAVEDKKIWSWFKRRGAKLIDKEAILTGVLQQSFEPEKFALGS